MNERKQGRDRQEAGSQDREILKQQQTTTTALRRTDLGAVLTFNNNNQPRIRLHYHREDGGRSSKG